MKKKKLNMLKKASDAVMKNENFHKTIISCGVLVFIFGIGFFLGFIIMGLLHHMGWV